MLPKVGDEDPLPGMEGAVEPLTQVKLQMLSPTICKSNSCGSNSLGILCLLDLFQALLVNDHLTEVSSGVDQLLNLNDSPLKLSVTFSPFVFRKLIGASH